MSPPDPVAWKSLKVAWIPDSVKLLIIKELAHSRCQPVGLSEVGIVSSHAQPGPERTKIFLPAYAEGALRLPARIVQETNVCVSLSPPEARREAVHRDVEHDGTALDGPVNRLLNFVPMRRVDARDEIFACFSIESARELRAQARMMQGSIEIYQQARDGRGDQRGIQRSREVYSEIQCAAIHAAMARECLLGTATAKQPSVSCRDPVAPMLTSQNQSMH